MDWADGQSFEVKLNLVLKTVEEVSQDGKKVSLIGNSAGGTMAVNAFISRPDLVFKVITTCSPLRTGGRRHPLLDRTDKGFPVVKAALARLDSLSSSLDSEQRKRIMTFIPSHDEIVPPLSMVLEGSMDKKYFGFNHLLNGAYAQVAYAKEMKSFLRK